MQQYDKHNEIHESTMDHEMDYTIGEDGFNHMDRSSSLEDDLNRQRQSYYGRASTTKDFETTVNDFFDKAVDGINTILNAGVRAGKRAYNDYKIRSGLNFKILEDAEVELLVEDHRIYYKNFIIDLLMMFSGVASIMLIPLVADFSVLILGALALCMALLSIGIYRMVKDSATFRRNTAAVRGKTVQITPKAEKWVKKKNTANRNNMYRSIAFAICCYILPMFGIVAAVALPFTEFFVILAMIVYLGAIGLGTGMLVYYTGMNTVFRNILEHRRFR